MVRILSFPGTFNFSLLCLVFISCLSLFLLLCFQIRFDFQLGILVTAEVSGGHFNPTIRSPNQSKRNPCLQRSNFYPQHIPILAQQLWSIHPFTYSYNRDSATSIIYLRWRFVLISIAWCVYHTFSRHGAASIWDGISNIKYQISIAWCVCGRMPWRKLPAYLIAQVSFTLR